MEAKLIKSEEGYSLIDLKGNPIAQTFGKFRGKKMSLRSCQAIERGYDLDELAEFYSTMTVFIKKDEIPTEKQIEDAEYISEIAFKAGFQKALELIGDKKFSEEDMIVFGEYCRSELDGLMKTKGLFNEFKQIKSLQKNEWRVEVEIEWDPKSTRCDECGEGGNYMNTPCDHPNNCNHWSAKYDSENCLILKRI